MMSDGWGKDNIYNLQYGEARGQTVVEEFQEHLHVLPSRVCLVLDRAPSDAAAAVATTTSCWKNWEATSLKRGGGCLLRFWGLAFASCTPLQTVEECSYV